MALFKKSHSRAKPVVLDASATPGVSYVDGDLRYTINLCAPGGPPYSYFELQLTQSEMLFIARDWFGRIVSAMERKS